MAVDHAAHAVAVAVWQQNIKGHLATSWLTMLRTPAELTAPNGHSSTLHAAQQCVEWTVPAR